MISPQEAANGLEKEIEISHKETCGECSGLQKGLNTSICETCGGQGRKQAIKKIKFSLPGNLSMPGVIKPMTRLRIAGEGDAGIIGGENGDLYIYLIIDNSR
ncbi:MAG: DnaJ C-terminal domain-containing protein [Nostoc sp.]|uniref:DnaJ C-terminal domain-containing protein n=1 Tax=Nostoc sp. TaxID=1180 RepID=UPI002FF70C3E